MVERFNQIGGWRGLAWGVALGALSGCTHFEGFQPPRLSARPPVQPPPVIAAPQWPNPSASVHEVGAAAAAAAAAPERAGLASPRPDGSADGGRSRAEPGVATASTAAAAAAPAAAAPPPPVVEEGRARLMVFPNSVSTPPRRPVAGAASAVAPAAATMSRKAQASAAPRVAITSAQVAASAAPARSQRAAPRPATRSPAPPSLDLVFGDPPPLRLATPGPSRSAP